MNEQCHRADPRILRHRTLERNHRRLSEVLRHGMSVLDVGCGTGAITADIARLAGPRGRVLGIDRDESLLALAREEHGGIANLRFAHGDILTLEFEERFDVVTAARTLQWIGAPEIAIQRMMRAAIPGGWIVVLDYNHENNTWNPDPPPAFAHFYAAFLKWRQTNGWSNRMAEVLPELFIAQGIRDVAVHVDDEVARRGEPGFENAAEIWAHVAETIGRRLVIAGFLTERELIEAQSEYRAWTAGGLQTQTLELRTVEGRIP